MTDKCGPPFPPPAAAAGKPVGKKKTVFEKAQNKRELDKARARTRINIGSSFERWRRLMQLHSELKKDEMVAKFLLDSYEKHSKGPCLSIQTTVIRNVQPPRPPPLSSNGVESQSTHSVSVKDTRIVDEDGANIPSKSVNLRTSSENRPEPLKSDRRDSTETCDSMYCESPSSSSNEDKQETCAAPAVCSSENGKAPGKKVAAPQRAGGQDRQLTIKLSQNEVNRDIQEDEDQEFSTTLSVGDGRYLVDLGSSSEFIVDEECILQLFKLCRECNKQCSVRKRVQGLKIVVHQTCCFCQSRFTWTNLPDADEDDGGDLQINGQTNTATSPSSNTS